MAIYFREPFYYVYVTYVFCNFCLSLIDFIQFVDTTVSSRHNHHHAFVNLDLIHHFISPNGKCWSGEVVFTIFTHYKCCIRPGTGDCTPHTENGVPAVAFVVTFVLSEGKCLESKGEGKGSLKNGKISHF